MSVALGVIVVTIFGVLTLYDRGMDRGRELNARSIAIRAVENEIETLRAMPFADLSPRTDAPFVSETPAVALLVDPEPRLTIAPAGRDGLVEVTAALRYRAGGRATEKAVTTLIARKGAP